MEFSFRQADYHCCSRCQLYQTCDTKWYRGEKGFFQHCCSRCEHSQECYASLPAEGQFANDIHCLPETAEQRIEELLRLGHFVCCERCPEFVPCSRERESSPLKLPRTCCSRCPQAKQCSRIAALSLSSPASPNPELLSTGGNHG